ncbi:MAG TPA: cohesin domain-containing protein [Saprospiraceae bacterium]|nr:cohesin domain-containing protein [Saprospiraceae bacterium]
MRKTLTILLLGLVVLPMTFLSSLSAKSLDGKTSPVWNDLESNLSEDPTDLIDVKSTDALMDFTLTASGETVAQGESFCVQMSVANFTDILGVEFLVNYDPAQLQFTAVQNLNLLGLTQSSFGKPGEGNNPAGQMKVSWFDQSISGVTVSDGTVIFDMCFTALSVDATRDIDFSNPEIIDISENILPFNGVAGTIQVGAGSTGTGGNGGGGNTGTGSTGDFTMTISDENVTQGQQVCVEVSTTNFTDILGVEAVFNYDSAKLQYTGVQSLNLAGLVQSSFGEPGVGANPAGQLKMSWFDQTVSGVTIADGTVILEICFTALASDATDNIFVSNDEIIDISENILPFVGETGTVTIGSGGSTGGGGGGGSSSDFTIEVADGTVSQGQEICVPVRVSNFTNILGVEVVFNYDPTKLQYNTVQNFNLSGLTQSGFGEPGVGANPQGQLKLSWFDQTVSGVTIVDGTAIFEICFTSLSSTGTTDVSMSNDEIIDINENILPFNGVAGTITQGMSTGGGNDDVELFAANATVNPNDNFCIGISANDFTDLSGMEFTLTYDPTVLGFTEVRNLNLNDLSQASFGLPGVGGNQPGEIKLSWFDMSGTGASVADGTVLFEACFDANASGTTTDIDFSGLELIDNNNMLAPSGSTAGTVTINQGMVNTDDFTLTVGSETVQAGDVVCVPLRVDNFDNILGMEFNVDYDPAVLRLTEIKDFNLKDLSASSFGLPGVGANQDGTIKLSWFDQAAAGVTTADGTEIFVMCFEAIGTGTTDIDIRNNGLEIIDGNENTVPATLQSGTISIEGIAATTDLQFIFGSTNASPGSQVCIPVTVNNFEDVLGMEFVMAYDPNALQFETVQNLNLDQLSASSFGLPGVGVNPAGEIKISWFDQQVQGVTVPDGTVIFELCFTVLAQSGTTNVGITQGRPIEFIDSNEDPIPFQLNPGTLTIVTFGLSGPAAITQVTCNGEATGAIDITVVGGSGSYSYSWSNAATTQDISNLPAGSYSVTVTDQVTNNTIESTFTITEPTSALMLQTNITDETCTGTGDGSISLAVSGGTGAYTYTWGGGLTGNVATQTSLTGGSYPVTITDANNCTVERIVEVESTPSVLIDNSTVSFIENGNDGAVSIEVSGGVTPYTYQWSGPNNFTATTEDINGLSASGEYCLTITDAGGCRNEMCFMVLEQLAFGNISTTNTCPDDLSGSIDISVTGGQAPYSFLWSNDATTEDLTNVGAGNYSVTVTDNLGNSFNGEFPVGSFAPLFVTETVTNVTGDENNTNGSISLSILGGNTGYTFNWDNGATTSTIDDLGGGEYCVSITDQNGCIFEECYTVEVITLPLAFSSTTTDVTCNGGSTGSAAIEIVGGAAPYAISFADNITLSSTDGSVNRDNLPAGTLSFVITDATNTTLQGNVVVDEPAPIAISNLEIVHDVDAPGCTGEISIALTGGTPGYTVQWNSPNTGMDIIGLCEGNYVPTIRDASGCTTSLDPIFVNTFFLDKQVQNVECRGDRDGGITITPNGGSGQYTYNWENASGQVISSQASVDGLVAGDYTVTVTETSGNTIVETITVGTSSTLSATANVETDYRGFGASCLDATDAIAMVNAANGNGDLMYTWMDADNNIVGDMERLANVGPGNYRVEVMDQVGCTVTQEVSITAPGPIEVNAFVTDLSCVGRRDGGITAVANGGTGSLNYRWSNQANSPTINLLVEGQYSLTVTDANGCEATNVYQVEEPEPIAVMVETSPAADGCNGVATATVSGGTGPYEYRWNSNAVSSDSIQTDLCPGEYRVAVVDANGCEASPRVAEAEVLDRRFPCMDMRTVISPNGDGQNDNFLINCIELTNNNRLLIFNQWSQLVFEVENYDNEWRGTSMNGEPLPEGAYYFIFEFTDNEGNFVQERGSITLLLKE